jgi:hypothetical protein
LEKKTSSRAITQPKIIRPERNSNLNCNATRYSHIAKFLAELWPLNLFFFLNFKFARVFFEVLWDIDLIFGMWLYLDELQFKFEFRSIRMLFGWVMALELVFFVQILNCPGIFWRPLRYWLDIWYVAISSWATV